MELQFKCNKRLWECTRSRTCNTFYGERCIWIIGSKWSGKNHFNADDMYSDNPNKRRNLVEWKEYL